jgi:hypothetical protein
VYRERHLMEGLVYRGNIRNVWTQAAPRCLTTRQQHYTRPRPARKPIFVQATRSSPERAWGHRDARG